MTAKAAVAPAWRVRDDFATFDTSHWRAEIEHPGESHVGVRDGELIMDTQAGMTLWFGLRLTGAYRIEFERRVLLEEGANDRLSDMNVFWGAHELDGSAGLRPRDGVLASYDSLGTFYVGMGGNDNRTTRFRRYDGTLDRPLLGERHGPANLLEAGRRYAIVIEVDAQATRYRVDGRTLFEQPLGGQGADGFFGLRSVWSRQAIGHFQVTAG